MGGRIGTKPPHREHCQSKDNRIVLAIHSDCGSRPTVPDDDSGITESQSLGREMNGARPIQGYTVFHGYHKGSLFRSDLTFAFALRPSFYRSFLGEVSLPCFHHIARRTRAITPARSESRSSNSPLPTVCMLSIYLYFSFLLVEQ